MYFVEHEPTFTFNTIQGYTEKYLLQKKIVSISQFLKWKEVVDLQFV